MGIFRQFPYTNFHEINLDLILNNIKKFGEDIGILEKKMDDFIAETEPTIRDEVDQWLDEHPEATTTVEDGSLTLPKFSDELKEDIIFNNETNIHKRKPNFVSDQAFVPNDHLVNGFTADDQYFYIAHHSASGGDAENLSITKVNRETLDTLTFTCPFNGHGSTLSYYDNKIYVMHGNSNRVDVVSATNPSFSMGYFNAYPASTSFSIKEINGRVITVNTPSSRNQATISTIKGNTQQVLSNAILHGANRSYVQGSDHTENYIYISRSFGQTIKPLDNYPVIEWYGYHGHKMLSVYLILDIIDDTRDLELEDIYRDTENELIYFVTASGRIGYISTSELQGSAVAHSIGYNTLVETEFFPAVLTKNESDLVIYHEGTALAKEIYYNPFSNQDCGTWTGNGMVAGSNAFVTSRAGVVILQSNLASYSNTNIYAYADYTWDSTNKKLVYRIGYVMQKDNNGAVTKTDLLTYSQNNPTSRTVINILTPSQSPVNYFGVPTNIITQ